MKIKRVIALFAASMVMSYGALANEPEQPAAMEGAAEHASWSENQPAQAEKTADDQDHGHKHRKHHGKEKREAKKRHHERKDKEREREKEKAE
jgi:hypothetical protein